MNEIEINIKSEICDQELADLLVAAFEGGINYWCDKVKILSNPENGEFASDVVPSGGVVKLLADGEWHELTKEKFLQGITKYCQENNETATEMFENHDAETADVIVQYAIFNELVYG